MAPNLIDFERFGTGNGDGFAISGQIKGAVMITDYEIIGWKSWYENDQFFQSRTTEWKDLPADGLIIVMLYENKRLKSGDGYYRRVCSNRSYYWTVPPNDLDVFYDDENPTERYPGSIIKRGKWVPYEEYEAVTKKAMETLEF